MHITNGCLFVYFTNQIVTQTFAPMFALNKISRCVHALFRSVLPCPMTSMASHVQKTNTCQNSYDFHTDIKRLPIFHWSYIISSPGARCHKRWTDLLTQGHLNRRSSCLPVVCEWGAEIYTEIIEACSGVYHTYQSLHPRRWRTTQLSRAFPARSRAL